MGPDKPKTVTNADIIDKFDFELPEPLRRAARIAAFDIVPTGGKHRPARLQHARQAIEAALKQSLSASVAEMAAEREAEGDG